jgi:hypothetical protein
MADPHTDWRTLEEISAQCGLSTRTLRRRLEEPRKGVKIETDYRRLPGRKPLLIVSPATVKALVAEVLTPMPMRSTHRASASVTQRHRDAGMMPHGDIVALIQALQRPRFPLPPRPWLTVKEAAEWSGLPENLLKKALREKKMSGFISRHWYVHSEDLATYSDSLRRGVTMSLLQPEE